VDLGMAKSPNESAIPMLSIARFRLRGAERARRLFVEVVNFIQTPAKAARDLCRATSGRTAGVRAGSIHHLRD
jgi:hypothetical protein